MPSLVLTTLGLIALALPAGFVPDTMARWAWLATLSGIAATGLVALLVWRAAAYQIRGLTLTAMRLAQGHNAAIATGEHPAMELRGLRRLRIALNGIVGRTQDTQLRVNRLAFFDPLTGLANRECFRRRVQAFLDTAKPGNEAALVLIDLDGFKMVNAAMGHDIGDDLLGQVGARLRDLIGADALSPERPILVNCRSDPTVARMGGDVFGIFLPHIGTSAALSLAERIRRRLGVSFPLEQEALQLGSSIGLATVPNDGMAYSALLKASEIAMHSAKRLGKNRVCIAGADDQDMVGVPTCISAGTLSEDVPLRYTPIYRAADLQLAGVEAVICEPQQFMAGAKRARWPDLLRESGMLHQTHHAAFDRALDVVTDITRKGAEPRHLFLRAPITLFLDDAFLAGVLDRLPLPFDLSFFAFDTPGSVSAATEAGWAIDRFSDAGVAIVLDDFGSEQGALTALLAYAPHLVRFDPRLTCAVAQSDGLANLTGSLVDMAHAADVGTIATDVASEVESARLKQLGFDYLQGPYLGAELSVDELVEHLRKVGDFRASERLQKLQKSNI